MPKSVELADVRHLLDRAGQLIDVLPAEEYRDEHLPGAINVPLKQLDADAATRLDRHRPLITYCHDSL